MTDEDVWIVLYLLSESVAARLRENHFRCRGVEVTLRDSSLFAFERQTKLGQPTMQEREIAQAAYLLYKKNYRWNEHLRSIGVRAIDLRPDTEPSQISFDYSAEKQESMEKLESANRRSPEPIRILFRTALRDVQGQVPFALRRKGRPYNTPARYLQGSI